MTDKERMAALEARVELLEKLVRDLQARIPVQPIVPLPATPWYHPPFTVTC